jgi:curli biogenesis system outer membrane secretion channel CsgG
MKKDNRLICAVEPIKNNRKLGMQTKKNQKITTTFGKVALTALCSLILTACVSTDPKMGSASGHTITGAAGGGSAEGQNSALESCDETLGTLSVFEDRSQTWWQDYRGRYPKLGSTIPVLRTMIQQSNCFVVVERGQAMAAMTKERELMQSGELRGGSNLGGGQMVAADYTMSPEIQFSAKGTSGMKAIGGALFGSLGAIVGGGLSSNEASTTLLLIDNRSGVQISAAVGNAENSDYTFMGGLFAGFMGGGASTFTDTPEGKVISASFADSFNKMVKALKSYKVQNVKGGLGKGGQLKVGN